MSKKSEIEELKIKMDRLQRQGKDHEATELKRELYKLQRQLEEDDKEGSGEAPRADQTKG